MNLEAFNNWPYDKAFSELMKCCASKKWAAAMAGRRPFADAASLKSHAEKIWMSLAAEDWLEAFSAHPKIGEKTHDPVAAKEQSGVTAANRQVLDALAEGNRKYETKFGFVFLICATGKSADEMLRQLSERLKNDRVTEMRNAAREQAQITLLRLERMA